MAIYRFKVSFEDYDDVVREIDLKSNHTFQDFHFAIHQSTKYNAEIPSSFYVSNDYWIKGPEISYLPSERKIENGVALMSNSKLSSFIDDPHQKFYYTYNFERPFDFHVELIKILLNDEPDKNYPYVFRSAGEVPRLAGFGILPVAPLSEEFDFLNEMEYASNDPEELSTMNDLGISDAENSEGEDEEDEISSENYDEDDLQKEDY
ncbi:MAG: hypothetical protein H7096_00845 [Flavobacterium sp.]|nr:hypothetical protein [Pedobacter sp.]